MLLCPYPQLRQFLGGLLMGLVASHSAAGESSGGSVARLSAPVREVLPLLEAWRRAEAYAATIPGGDVMVGRGESMMPLYPDSTVIVVQRVPIVDLRPGMVVVFIGDTGRPVAHTLVANGPRGWSAKGVANGQLDRTRVRSHNYLGTVVHAYVPYLPDATPRPTPAGALANVVPAGAGRVAPSGT